MKHNTPPKLRVSVSFQIALIWIVLLGTACNYLVSPSPQPTLDILPSLQPTSATPIHTTTALPSVTPETVQTESIATPTVFENPSPCDGLLTTHLLAPPEKTKDLFEHHAKGVFLIFYIEIFNLTAQDIQIYSNDYLLLIPQGDSTIALAPHKAATNYLYIVRGGSFYQDKIKAGTQWKTYLAFDIEPEVTDWQLIISPGSTVAMPICESRLAP